jgi:hypothetical protein
VKKDQAFAFGGHNSNVVANAVTWFESGEYTIVQAAYALAKRIMLPGRTVAVMIPDTPDTDWNDVLTASSARRPESDGFTGSPSTCVTLRQEPYSSTTPKGTNGWRKVQTMSTPQS